ncbi:MAG: hypothetical protein CME71_02565 [Halobacteriovorax sp.]|nr:hypothetical protein [Halobacteriovorax sp.]
MNLYLAKILCLSLFLPAIVFAQDTGTEPVEEVPEFKLHMIDHPFEGCPGGSKCTEETGKHRKAWHDTLKTKRLSRSIDFHQKFGVPMAMWSQPVSPVTKGLALWDSPCSHHNLENSKIFLAEVMTTNFEKLAQQRNLLIGKAVLRKSSTEFIQYPIPRAEAPIYLKSNKMIYSADLDGEYYFYSIAADGSVEIVKGEKPARFPENIQCTEDMVQAFKKIPYPENLFKGASCKSIWDMDSKSFKSIVYGWSCS